MEKFSTKKYLIVCFCIYALLITFLLGNSAHIHLFQWDKQKNCISCFLNLTHTAGNPLDAQANIHDLTKYEKFESTYHDHCYPIFLTGIESPRAPPG